MNISPPDLRATSEICLVKLNLNVAMLQCTKKICQSWWFISLRNQHGRFLLSFDSRRFCCIKPRGINGRSSFVLRLSRGHGVTTFREKNRSLTALHGNCIVSYHFRLYLIKFHLKLASVFESFRSFPSISHFSLHFQFSKRDLLRFQQLKMADQ